MGIASQICDATTLNYNCELRKRVVPNHREQEVFPFFGIEFYAQGRQFLI